jgi:hypothetical protein
MASSELRTSDQKSGVEGCRKTQPYKSLNMPPNLRTQNFNLQSAIMACIALLVLALASLSTSDLISNILGGGNTVTSDSQEVFAERSYFYVGGYYVNASVVCMLLLEVKFEST